KGEEGRRRRLAEGAVEDAGGRRGSDAKPLCEVHLVDVAGRDVVERARDEVAVGRARKVGLDDGRGPREPGGEFGVAGLRLVGAAAVPAAAVAALADRRLHDPPLL